MKIFLGADHRGFKIKNILKEYLQKLGYQVIDCGAFKLDSDDDYPDFVIPVAKAVAKDKTSKGIILGASGQGEAIAANRIKGARAAVYYGGSKKIIVLSREHNDANILSLGAAFLSEKQAKEAVKLWLKTKFSKAKRHIRRIKKIEN